MVLQKRLDYGFSGYQVPAIPRATRSARKRVPFRKRVEDNQISAFDLLATVAGKLLLDKETASNTTWTAEDQPAAETNTIKEERGDVNQSLKLEFCNQDGANTEFIVSEPIPQTSDPNCSSKESPSLRNGALVATSDCLERVDAQKLMNDKIKNEMEGFPSVCGTSGDCIKPVSGNKVLTDEELDRTDKASIGEVADKCSFEDALVSDVKPPALLSSDFSRDDDEKSSGCTHPSPLREPFRSTPHIGDRRIRKILASKYWKVASRSKNVMCSNYDENLKSGYCNRRAYKRLTSGRNYPFKKRKFFYCSSESNSDGGTSCEGISDSAWNNNNNGNTSFLYSKMHGVTGESSSPADQHQSFTSRNSHVKLRIKSFRVPELFIEVPESATVGSLKRTVMEAVTAILGDGLCVGVLLQGKKVRDDNKTLLQTGISCDNQMDALGFSLEPNPSHTPPSLCPGDSPLKLIRDTPLPVYRYPANPGLDNQVTCDLSPKPRKPNSGNSIETLIAAPALSMETLAVVRAHKKPKQSEVAQRRIRRPFFITEVEALVQAVEKLGTGRWRDVKLRAFDKAKHRTYDKWKTLLHTARISPQQRRGDPVPQDLLDRVLNAHTYWSQQQAKQQPLPESCLLYHNSNMIASSRRDVDEKILA
ncbi:TRF-like 2, putative isoform 2 [Hibiscus syriacus]|uniref:TRF-like 2, putative isoform 2 n=1 Tax=Hibiscus syriacus TaxID=106335 RepID=A0A6A3CYG0_HIBSY|nr:TRF-like 2, putative isoform 2 [Hibiscus syriacus]